MKHKILLLAFTSMLAISASAHAEEGFYVGIGGGANNVHDDKVKGSGISAGAEYDWGYAAAGTLGYAYDNGIRSELELGYRDNSLDSIGTVSANGDVDAMSAMLNVLYDFDVSDMVDTYVGVGGGVVKVDYNNFRTLGGTVINDSDTVPAVQGIAGASLALTEKTDVFLNYQYLHAIDPSFKDSTNAKIETDYDSSMILVGLKYKLYGTTSAPVEVAEEAAPVVAAAPEAAPAPISRTYIVFFDFDKSELTPEAMAVLKQASEDAQAGNAVALQVVGHADRAGSDSYNMALSNRRANTVESALTQLGLSNGNIQTMAKGESEPLVQTDDGVREPQNRRVEVMYVIDSKK
jgi:OOP family OmpA-OmpF porin